MEAKEIEKILKEWLKRASPELSSLIEISFRAGIKEAQGRLNSQEVLAITKEALANERLVGIRKVVGWIEKNLKWENFNYDKEIGWAKRLEITDEWQAQKKKWGIE